MKLFLDRHRQLLKVLLDKKVDFMIIGGYAVIYYGYKRTTGDLDIWLKPDNTNKPKMTEVLQIVGISEQGLEEFSTFDFTRDLMFRIWEPPEQVDFMTRINVVDYEEAAKDKVFLETEDLDIPIIHLNHLVLSKISTGRLKDKADVEKLQNIIRLKGKE